MRTAENRTPKIDHSNPSRKTFPMLLITATLYGPLEIYDAQGKRLD
jgi:hypothetical protein